MEKSLFIQYILKFFTGIVTSVTAKLNDKEAPLPYYHKRFLRKEFSVDGKWESVSQTNTLVMADVVAMDSEIPLKRRDSLARAGGDIPKMGMELKLNEKQLTDLDTLALRPGTEQQLIVKLFQDTPRVIGGIFERNEAIFLEALSSGVVLVEDDDTVGTGIRMDYKYPTNNKFGVSGVAWTNIAAVPLNDLAIMQKQASTTGRRIIKFLMDPLTFEAMVLTTQVKEGFAFNIGFAGTANQSPSLDQLNSFLASRYRYTVEIIDRSVVMERNGNRTLVTPWVTGAVVGICTEDLGLIVWANLAEKNHPVANVTYETADEYILVSKFRQNKPSLTEVTASQSRVVPVLTNTDQIYLLDTEVMVA